ncbi:MAG: iron-sulfur cluster carrier protein ApbC [Acidobacteria bacterium]|nr:MAG: iron-sulfur cluster carrier protein ApbC [Acidobacteriota bacterium]
MSDELEGRVWEALKTVRYPGMSRDVVSFGFVRRVEIAGGVARVALEMSTHNPQAAEEVRRGVEQAVGAVGGIGAVEVEMNLQRPAAPPAQRAVARDAGLIPGIEHVVAVASGKGGVGKSTVAANLAVRLAQLGHTVGLLDADIYGPSIPTMFGIDERPRVEGERMLPFSRFGVKLMSLGFVLEMDTPVIWRGPMVMRALEQLLGDVDWGKLEYLIADLPPGTGDAQLTLTQKVPLAGAVIVTTPQDVALIDARKGLAMFRKVNVPVIGIVENMSGFVCPSCGETTEVFKRGGGRRTAEVLGCPFLGSIPLDPAIVAGGDAGEPIVVSQPDGPHAEAFRRVAEAVAAEVARRSTPQLKIV